MSTKTQESPLPALHVSSGTLTCCTASETHAVIFNWVILTEGSPSRDLATGYWVWDGYRWGALTHSQNHSRCDTSRNGAITRVLNNVQLTAGSTNALLNMLPCGSHCIHKGGFCWYRNPVNAPRNEYEKFFILHCGVYFLGRLHLRGCWCVLQWQ
jgi:hypothetical protein